MSRSNNCCHHCPSNEENNNNKNVEVDEYELTPSKYAFEYYKSKGYLFIGKQDLIDVGNWNNVYSDYYISAVNEYPSKKYENYDTIESYEDIKDIKVFMECIIKLEEEEK